MEEKDYGINWLGLFIKVIIFVIIVLLAIWLISKLTLKDKGLSFEENNKKFQDATIEYFKTTLPDKKEKVSLTLNQLISWDYLEELKNKDGKLCDKKNSKSTIEVVEDYYNVKTILVCGNKSETTYIKLGNEKCTNCDIKIEGLKEIKKDEPVVQKPNNVTGESSKGPSTNNNVSNNNVSNNDQNTAPSKIVLYEYIKEVDEYSDWYTGKVTGNNIENSKKTISYSKYCKNGSKCITDKTDSKNSYPDYKIIETWNEEVDIYRYKITIVEYKYSNETSLEGYTKTGKTKIAE